MATQKYTAEQMSSVLAECRGLIYPTSRRLGCDPCTVRNYMKRYPSVQAVVDEQRSRLVDSAEEGLIEAVEERREGWALAFVLKTLGKERGYVERTERDISQTTTVVHEHRHRLEALSIDDLEALEAIGAKLTEARSGARRLPGDTIDAGEEEPEMVRSERLSEL